ncbi:hypothetical protein Glove_299g66 [Diversispora epigaea]|uniref:Uncharacterized protein n=1 Tax=Diversispora epigaea TaxID=1348612 RepID=A0A397I300_9GLOM|nr:hypothetical protein Glove_299g66 [Diversispora epigaea]
MAIGVGGNNELPLNFLLKGTKLDNFEVIQNGDGTAIARIFSGYSRFVKLKKSEVSTLATAKPRTTSRQASRTTLRQASLQPRQELLQPQPLSPHVIISRHLSPSLLQTTSRKRKKTKTGVIEIDDDAPLIRKEVKIFFNKLKKEISDIRKLLEMSCVGDYTTEESFIKLLAKHQNRRGAIATRIRSSFFSTFKESDLPTINIKSTASEVKDVLRKLNQDIDSHENLTWCTKIMEKIWKKSRKKKLEKGETIEFEKKSNEESKSEEESEEESSEEEEKKGKEREEREEKEEKRWEGEERRLGKKEY